MRRSCGPTILWALLLCSLGASAEPRRVRALDPRVEGSKFGQSLGRLYQDLSTSFRGSTKAVEFATHHSLATDEAIAIRYYTWSSQWLNKALASKPNEHDQLRAGAIAAALRKLPDYRGTVHRGSIDWFRSLSRLKVGQVYRPPAFLSCSTDKQVVDTMFHYPVRMTIHSLTGKNIESLSLKPAEHEVVFCPGASFRVIRSEPGMPDRLGGKTHILELQELPSQRPAARPSRAAQSRR